MDSPLELKGQWLAVDERSVEGVPGGGLLFLGSPRCANLEDLQNQGLYLSDIPLHDLSRDFVLLAEQRAAEAGLKERFEAQSVELAKERAKSDRLLHAMVPEAVADTLRAGQPAPSRCPPGTCFCDPRCTRPSEEKQRISSLLCSWEPIRGASRAQGGGGEACVYVCHFQRYRGLFPHEQASAPRGVLPDVG